MPATSIRDRRNTKFQEKIAQMQLTLSPIYPLPSGPPHQFYPQTLLHYWLLTESQLDSLAEYYHQTSPTNQWRPHYPTCMNWDRDFLAVPNKTMSKDEQEACLPDEERLTIKRRMLGKFIGLRGCETPLGEYEKRIKFLEGKMERAARKEKWSMTTKWPF